jgi:leucyl/phenylalanyl-tRNA--protein transferase
MCPFRLNKDPVFPSPLLADANGLLAIGGDLKPERLIAAYRSGIFPWFTEDQPLLWWFLDPRLVLFPGEFTSSRRLRREIRQGKFRVSFDLDFPQVITACARVRTDQGEATWINRQMIDAYCHLHELGYAHSVECWQGDSLAGGLYGIALDRVFFGESMFTRISNGSKIALAALVERLRNNNFQCIDCQMTTRHLLSCGAREISGQEFLRQLDHGIHTTTPSGKWNHDTF